MPADNELVERVKAYLKALEAGDGAALRAFYHPEAVQTELPNQLNPKGQKRGVAVMLKDLERSKGMLKRQSYRLDNAIVAGDQLAAQLRWEAELAIPVAGLNAGDSMTASFAVFFSFKDGKVLTQYNYDCFDPLPSA